MNNYTTSQEKFWSEEIGQAYMEHNKFEPELRKEKRKEFYDLFNTLDKEVKILECGCNNGTNLAILSSMGFNNLYGLEIFEGAANEARKNNPKAQITVGTLLDLPYNDNEFDAVFTSGVLIHQNPQNSLIKAVSEIYRVSNQFIFGLEDYAGSFQCRSYRGKPDAYWFGPYCDFIQKQYPNLDCLHTSHCKYSDFPIAQYVFQK